MANVEFKWTPELSTDTNKAVKITPGRMNRVPNIVLPFR